MPNNPNDYLQQGQRANERITEHEKDCAERYEEFTKEMTAMKGDTEKLNLKLDHLDEKVTDRLDAQDEKLKSISKIATVGTVIASTLLTVITIIVGIIAFLVA